MNIQTTIAQELNVKPQQVSAAVELLDEGSTVPFISRYRKEVTGGLDDTQLRQLEERLKYLRELEDRRAAILKSITEQEKLTPELEKAIIEAGSKTRLEDLYLPYKPKRRTKAQIAREAGLEPLADALHQNPELVPEAEAEKYLNEEHKISDAKSALDGAKQILMERFAEDADLLQTLRNKLWKEGLIVSEVIKAQEKEKSAAKFRDYFEHQEPIQTAPSHRALAMFRGRNEGALRINVSLQDDDKLPHPCEAIIAEKFAIQDLGRAADKWLGEVVRWTWKIKLLLSIETDLLSQVRQSAEAEAIRVFAKNLSALLMAAPAGAKTTMGLDPGIRTGVKVAIVDQTGKFIDHATIYPFQPKKQYEQSIATLANLCKKHKVELISIGNGTASRETDKLVADLFKQHSEINAEKIMVNEAGASIYSASELASREFPNVDVTIRGAISIARRLQDPLAELVKIEPKSIGVGQYQHDVNQLRMAKSLDTVIEDCVNSVGVDINMASAPLLARISGLNTTLANNIVEFRDKNGAFKERAELKQVTRFGERTFEQAAGFLRVMNGNSILDSTSVHPEAYGVVTQISEKNDRPMNNLIGDSAFLKSLIAQEYTSEQFGLPTVRDILKELDKPARDPRPEFKTAQFKDGVDKVSHLEPGMILEGTVTNITNFGAFVDIGVHQDGLVHISVMANTFIKDPHDIVSAGDIVKVKVVEVDEERNRIALSMRLNDERAPQKAGNRGEHGEKKAANTAKHRKPQTGGKTNQQSAKLGSLFSKDDLAKLKSTTRK